MTALGERAIPPVFQFPTGFQQRLGTSPEDAFFSGTYLAGGYKIGFLRIGTFQPVSTGAALSQLTAEVQYLSQNTDGLVLDVTRNDGGDATYQDQVAQLFFPAPFNTLAEQARPTLDAILSAANFLSAAQQTNPPNQALIGNLQQVYNQLNSAYTDGQRLTGPLLLHNAFQTLSPATDQSGNTIAYSKPMLLLVDENTACGAEAFAAVFQDNQRGLTVGKTTQGAGGAIEPGPGGFFSEAQLGITRTLFVRGSGSNTSYIQNAGVTPDVFLEYMTVANLTGNGQPFVNAFTSLIVNELSAQSPH
ncbi:MAG TPA: S41 family peptidase [Bryobacteraceae bacterium]|nr:S41 family peptidase [Bryobacteraceae bacterium]